MYPNFRVPKKFEYPGAIPIDQYNKVHKDKAHS